MSDSGVRSKRPHCKNGPSQNGPSQNGPTFIIQMYIIYVLMYIEVNILGLDFLFEFIRKSTYYVFYTSLLQVS